MRLHNIKQVFLLFPLFLLTVSVAYSQNPTFDSLANEINRISIYKKTKSLEMLDSLYQMAYSESDRSLLIARCLYEESLLYYRQGIDDTMLTDKIKKRLDHEHLSLMEQALLQTALGIRLGHVKGDYAEEFSLQLQALEKFKLLKNNYFTARTLNLIGNICSAISMHNLAEYYYSEALQYVTPESSMYYCIKNNVFILTADNDIEAAIDSMLNLIAISEKENHEEILPTQYHNMGSFYLDTLPEKALIYFTKMQTLDFDSPITTAFLYGNMGYYYQTKNDYPNALNFYRMTQKLLQENTSLKYLAVTYGHLSSIFEDISQCDSALFYARKYEELIQRLHSNTIAVETHQKYITTILEDREKDLVIAEQTVALKNRQFVVILTISGAAVLLISLFLLFVNQQKRRKASENRELTAKLAHEEDVQQYEKREQKLEKEKQEEILDTKTREITSYSLLVSNKNHLLKQIMGLNAQVFDNKENALEIASQIDEIIQNSLDIDDEWENFKMHFDKVHPHFFEKLKQLCNDLTEENLKLCAYFKIGMTTKQIAQLLHVVPNSIFTNRYRLRKKLQLPDEKDLDDFIRSL